MKTVTSAKKCRKCNYGTKKVVHVTQESRMDENEAWTPGYQIMYECEYCGWISIVFYFDHFGRLEWSEEKC